MKTVIRAVAVLACGAAIGHAAPPTKWTIQTLGDIGGGGTIPQAINNRGDIVGWGHTASGDIHGFLWRDGTLIDAGTPNGRYSGLYAINDHGVAFGQAGETLYTYDNGTWTASPVANGFPYGINKFGDLAGISYGNTGQRGFEVRDGVLWEVPLLPGSAGGISELYAINDKGVATGGSSTGWGQEHAITFKSGVITDLGTLGGAWGVGRDINDRGVVVGQSSDGTNSRAFVWDGAMRPVCSLGGSDSDGQAINDRGDIVGTFQPGNKAYLCQDEQLTVLNDIPEVKAAGWVQLFPMDMNDRGWITGWGWKYGGSPNGEGFVLIPR